MSNLNKICKSSLSDMIGMLVVNLTYMYHSSVGHFIHKNAVMVYQTTFGYDTTCHLRFRGFSTSSKLAQTVRHAVRASLFYSASLGSKLFWGLVISTSDFNRLLWLGLGF